MDYKGIISYDGEFKNDKISGLGVGKYIGGKVLKGHWDNYLFIGEE